MRPTNRIRPVVDGLEPRCVPAGNVVATVVNGTLHITGDAEANEIVIQEIGGDLNVTGVGTTVNGLAFETFPGVYLDVRVDLLGGDDGVQLSKDAVVSRDLIFLGGDGADGFVGEAGSGVGRNLIVRGGAGDVNVALDGVLVGRDVRVRTTDVATLTTTGNTKVNGALDFRDTAWVSYDLEDTDLGRFRAAVSAGSLGQLDTVAVGGNFVVIGGSAEDGVLMTTACDIQGNFVFRGGGDTDGVGLMGTIGGDVRIGMGTGDFSGFFATDVTVLGGVQVVSTGASVDIWTTDGLNVLGSLVFRSTGGDDTIKVDRSNVFGPFRLAAGGGADAVALARTDDVIFRGDVKVRLGDGDDILDLGHGAGGTADFRAAVLLDGGLGVNTLAELSADYVVAAESVGF